MIYIIYQYFMDQMSYKHNKQSSQNSIFQKLCFISKELIVCLLGVRKEEPQNEKQIKSHCNWKEVK